jgi:hypothetical protein
MTKLFLIGTLAVGGYFLVWLFFKIWFEKIPEEVRVLDSIRNMLNKIKIELESESDIEYDSGEEMDQYFRLADSERKFLVIVYPEGLTGFGKEKWLGYRIKADDEEIVKKIEKQLQELAREYNANLSLM